MSAPVRVACPSTSRVKLNIDYTATRSKPGLGFGWPSPCNRVAQTCPSVPCSTQEPMPTMMAAFVAARSRQRPNTKSSMAGVYSHTDTRRTYGECQALVYSAIFCDWKDAVEISKDRGEELVSATTGPDSGGNDSCHHHRAGEG